MTPKSYSSYVLPSPAQAGLGEKRERGKTRDASGNGKKRWKKKNGEQSPDTISFPPQRGAIFEAILSREKNRVLILLSEGCKPKLLKMKESKVYNKVMVL
jgi:hypothetical protein